ncbi:U3 small nucleolar RNA-associated protein 13, partial [Haplosporangium bisporale]
LSNYLQRKDWKNAITLALSLEQPFRLLQLFNQIQQDRPEHDASVTGLEAVDKVLRGLSLEQIGKLLGYVRDWNTHAKNMRAAQTVLNAILRDRKVQEMITVPGIKDLLDGLIPYSDRHFQRVEALSVRSYVVDYTVQAMDLMTLMGSMDLEEDEEEDVENVNSKAYRKREEERQAKERHDAFAAARSASTTANPSELKASSKDSESMEDVDGDEGDSDEEASEDEEDEEEAEEEDSDEDMA